MKTLKYILLLNAVTIASLLQGAAAKVHHPAPHAAKQHLAFTQVAIMPYVCVPNGDISLLLKTSAAGKVHYITGRKTANHNSPFDTKSAILKNLGLQEMK